KSSTSNLLVDNCDDFIYYDDLIREHSRKASRKETSRVKQGRAGSGPDEDDRRAEALELVMDTVDALFREREGSSLCSSMVKQPIKRKRPNFAENYHGYRNFNELLEDARTRGLLQIQKDERSGGYVITGFGS